MAAGSAGKITGAILFALGATIVLIAGSIVALGVSDQADNEQQGPMGLGEDNERTQDNMQTATAGVIGMALGGLVAIGGLIAIAVGISQRTGEIKGHWVTARDQRNILIAKTGAVASIDPDAPAGDAAQDDNDMVVVSGRLGRPAIIGLSILAAALVIGIVVVGLGIDGPLTGDAPTNGGPDGAEAGWLGNETFERSIPATFTVMGNSQASTGSSHEFAAYAGTHRLTATVDWSPTSTGVDSIDFSIEIDAGNGWVEVGTVTAGPGLTLEILDADLPEGSELGSATLRFRAYPGSDGATNGQSYSVLMEYYSA